MKFLRNCFFFLFFFGTGLASVAHAVTITEFPTTTPGSGPDSIVLGPDGNLWFTEFSAHQIGQIAPDGTITEFNISTPGSKPEGITVGPDGNIWFTDSGANMIGRITTSGVVTEFSGLSPSSTPVNIVAGPDGALWFTEFGLGNIGRITTAGVVTDEFPVTSGAGSEPFDIAVGPDGNLWFTESSANNIGTITTAGVVTEFPNSQPFGKPFDIITGPDGALWFTDPSNDLIGRMTTSGQFTQFPTPTANSGPSGITVGADGNIWFTEDFGASGGGIGRSTLAGEITEFLFPTFGGADEIAVGSDGALWFTEFDASQIGRLAPPGALQFSAASYSVNESAGTATITINRIGGSDGVVTVQFTTSDGSALAGTDYTAVTQTVTFADGDTTPKTVDIPILQDLLAEGNETINLTLSDPTGEATLGIPSQAILTIVDIPGGELGGGGACTLEKNTGSSRSVPLLMFPFIFVTALWLRKKKSHIWTREP
jgi:streptogramin lyase